MSEHLTHYDAGTRAIIEREVAKERERIAGAIVAACDHRGGRHVCASCWDAARIARGAGTQ